MGVHEKDYKKIELLYPLEKEVFEIISDELNVKRVTIYFKGGHIQKYYQDKNILWST